MVSHSFSWQVEAKKESLDDDLDSYFSAKAPAPADE